ncbi:hypothetical protein C8K30_113134 [Promicromonospora sp. AC04]|uniref:hypothetical protein n=1 Tax=Promicromonospora sp. AC04 TaxID=2135723 RepID=UPI000D3937FD|nr:hypothetical protein [Promicromonospora sp. AC04]PUB22264.1 hypothetical protein C8K30_113134 [Promicromonospora sp. AC04]
MERLLYELDQMGVTKVWLETRHESLNRRDTTMAAALYSQQMISKNLRVDFGRPKEEPMLWVPDAVAGAVSAARHASEVEIRLLLGDAVLEIDIDLQ